MNIEFKEKQKFTQWWLWLLLGTSAIIPIVAIYLESIQGGEFGENPSSGTGLNVATIAFFSVIALIWLIRLKTEIDHKEVRMIFSPFVKKTVQWNEIKKAEVLNYGFVGGWGIRLWTKYGTVYNIKGNKGLAIELKNGKKFLIGTQKEEELKRVVEKLRQNNRDKI